MIHHPGLCVHEGALWLVSWAAEETFDLKDHTLRLCCHGNSTMGEEDGFSHAVCVCVCEVAASHRHRRRAKIRLWWKELQWLHFPECPSALASFLLPCASFGAFGMASAGSLQLDAEWNHMCSLLSFKQTRAVSNVSNVQSLFSLRGRERWVMGGQWIDALLELSADFTLNALPLSITSAQSLPRFQKTSKNSFLCLLVWPRRMLGQEESPVRSCSTVMDEIFATQRWGFNTVGRKAFETVLRYDTRTHVSEGFHQQPYRHGRRNEGYIQRKWR